MNEQIKAQLAKYMKSNGFYDTKQIRIDEGKSEIAASFDDIFGESDPDDSPEVKSEMLAAAEEYNEQLIASKETEKIGTVESLLAEYDQPLPVSPVQPDNYLVATDGEGTYKIYTREAYAAWDGEGDDPRIFIDAIPESDRVQVRRFVELDRLQRGYLIRRSQIEYQLYKMNLARQYDSGEDVMALDVSPARAFINGNQTDVHPLFATDMPEENLANSGL